MRRDIRLLAFLAFSWGTGCAAPDDLGSAAFAADTPPVGSGSYVPGAGDDWERRDPADAGFDPAGLAAAIEWALANETSMPSDPGQYLRDRFEGQRWQDIVGPTQDRGGVNGILLHDGYIVAEWGDTRRPDMTFSVTKSYLSAVVGLARDQGLIPDLDAPVRDLISDGGFDSPHNSRITWRQHLQQLSEWEGTLFGKPDEADRRRGIDRELQTPGTFWEYNDVRVNRLALSALRLFETPLPVVLREGIMDPIGASDTWEWNGYETSWVDVNGERLQSVSGGGHWGGGMVISSRDHARFGLLMSRDGVWGDRRILSREWIAESLTPSIQPNYGFMWWLNTEREQFPHAPESSFFALGAGSTSTIWVDPDHDLVLVSRWIDGPQVNELIGRILQARTDRTDGPAANEPAERVPFTVGVAPSFAKVFAEDPVDVFPGHFDERVEIEVARNETEGVQIVLFPTEAVEDVRVAVTELTGPDGVTIPTHGFEIRTVGYVNLVEPKVEGGRTGWHPDPLLPNQPVDLEAGVAQPFLVSVRTTRNEVPGEYSGRIVVEGGGTSVERELVVRVRDVRVPDTPRFKTTNLADWGAPARMWPGRLGYPRPEGETALRDMLRLAELGFEYRLPPTVYLANGLRSWNAPRRGNTRSAFPTHDLGGGAGPRFNPARTDLLIDFMLDRGANHFFVALTANVWRPPGGNAERPPALTAYLREYRDHLRGRGLLDMAYVYGIDEPWGEEVEHSKRTFTLVREAVGTDLRFMQNTNQNNRQIIPQFLGFFDALDINLGFYDVMDTEGHRQANPEALREIWWNVNIWPATHPNLFIEFPLIDARIIGPLSYAYRISGFEYWDMLWVGGMGNYHPVEGNELRVDWDVDSHSLDGSLIYPATDREIYPSLRLLGLRDGFEDLEMLYLLEDLDPSNPLLEIPIITGLGEYAQDPADYLAWRSAVMAAIEAAAP
ncbi:MAG: serine hydrolase [Gemmatimonadota bacterium]|nr:serine hydrolase [Gemmatimonadota bacterium]